MEEVRRPLFMVAVILMVVVVGLEIGSQFVLTAPHRSDRAAKVLSLPGVSALISGAQVDRSEVADEAAAHRQPPGLAIPAQALIDGLLLVTVLITGLTLRGPARATGSALGAASLTASMVAVLAGIFLVDLAVARLRSVVGLYLRPPFGTLIYLTLFGFFDRERSLFVLGGLIVLKLAACVLLLRADDRFGQNGLVVGLLITSVVVTVMVSILYSVVPLTMVSITDSIAALAAVVIGLVWAAVVLIGSMTSVLRDLGNRQPETATPTSVLPAPATK